jgi:hypothetical protein
LEEGAAAVSFSADGRFVFVRVGEYFDVPFERRSTLRSTSDGKPMDLKASSATESAADAVLSSAVFSPDAEATYIHAFFSNNSQRLFRTSDLSVVDIEDGWLNAGFVPPPLGLVIILHPYGRTELRAWDDGRSLGDLPSPFVAEIVEHQEADPPFAVVTFDELSGADPRPLIIDSNGVVVRFKAFEPVVVSPDPQASWLMNGGEIWSRLPRPGVISSLARPDLAAFFDSSGNRLVVGDYVTGSAYLLDLRWLKSIEGVDLEVISDHDLISFVCEGPAGALVHATALAEEVERVRPGTQLSTCLE